MKLNELAKEIHQNAKDKGFWDEEREVGTLLMLCVSELAEAMEADRRGENSEDFNRFNWFDDWEKGDKSSDSFKFRHYFNDTFESELADTVIRILDICGAKGIDIERHIELKMKYNKTRENKHGCKY